MTEAQFWNLIDETRASSEGNAEGQALELEDRLIEMEEKEVIDFVQHLQALLAESYDAYLWSASYLVNGNADDETFEGFRAWIISRGKDQYDLIRENADAIIDLFDHDDVDQEFQLVCPGLLYAGFSAWEEITGDDPEDMPLERKEVDLKGEFDPESWDDAYLESEFPLLFEVLG